MTGTLDSLVRFRRLIFDRMTSCTSRATSEVGRARELHEQKRTELISIEERREAASKQLAALRDARWLSCLWVSDLRLAKDSLRVRHEMGLAENDLASRREELQKSRRELALAQAKLQISRNLAREQRRAGVRRRERRSEDEVSGIRTRCL